MEDQVVEQTVRIEAPPEKVWRYWTSADGMAAWWGKAADLDPRPGGPFVVELAQGPVMRGEFLELVPYERLVFTFGWDGMAEVPPGSTRVEVTLAPEGSGSATVLTLRHTGLPEAQAGEHTGGWGHFLSVLAEAAAS
jgi:uncharacterized protein YndB with AHSA1/START domain